MDNIIDIRNVRVEDASRVARAHANAWRSAYKGIVPDAVLDAMSEEKGTPIFLEKIVIHIKSETPFPFLVATINEEVIGFAHSTIPKESPANYDCELGAIYVDPSFHNLGAGTALVRETAIRFINAGLKQMIIWSFATNPWRKFYEKIGGEILPIQKEKVIGGKSLQLIAYGWNDLGDIVQKLSKS